MDRHRTPRLLLLVLLSAAPALASETLDSRPGRQTGPSAMRVQEMLQQQARRPDDVGILTDLARAYLRHARAHADPRSYRLAERALVRGLELSPSDRRALETRVALLVGQCRFREAASLAERLADSGEASAELQGSLLDAYLALGRYEEVWGLLPPLLAHAPDQPAVLVRASRVVELSGDLLGAGMLMEQALAATPHGALDQRAWYLTRLAGIDRQLGEPMRARRRLDEALRLSPEYPAALEGQARVSLAMGDSAAAVAWAERRCERGPRPGCYFDLGMALDRHGERGAAEAAFAVFEPAARREIGAADNANRELVRFYLEQAARPGEALRIARIERSRRADVETRTLYAAALSAVGRAREALDEVEFVLAQGTATPWILRELESIDRQARRKGDRAGSASEEPGVGPARGAPER